MEAQRRNIYIIQMQTGTIPARFVKMMTGYKYSHVGICMSRECDCIYSFGRKKPNNFLVGGFVVQKPGDDFLKKFNATICRIFELPVSEEQYQALQANLDSVKQNCEEYRYDFLGVALRFFHIPVKFKRKYVCSQFVAEMLEKANICSFDKRTCFVEPRDFEGLNNAVAVYTGKYPIVKV